MTDEKPLLVLHRDRDQPHDTYWVERETLRILNHPANLPSKVCIEHDKNSPRELNEVQKLALVEILTGLGDGAAKGYGIEIRRWDDSLIETWW